MSSNSVPLPAGTVLGKSFEYGLDINLGLFGTPLWQPTRRISAWAPAYPKVTADLGTYDDRGAPNEGVSGRGFAGAFTVQANRSLTTGLYLPEIEALVAAGKSKGEAAVIDVRFYHKPDIGTPNPNDAGRAQVTVEFTRQNTGNTDIEILAVSLAGQGEYEPIANPFTGWGATAPIIGGLTPVGAGDGEMVVINGSGFLGATAVTFDGIAVPEFVVISGASIAAILPAGDAETVPVVVTTPGGASTPFAYPRGA